MESECFSASVPSEYASRCNSATNLTNDQQVRRSKAGIIILFLIRRGE